MVGAPPPPAHSGWQAGLYWLYASALAVVSIGYLAIASPIIMPTLPTHPWHLLFCISAGTAIADGAAHAIREIAGIWQPHDLGGATERRSKFSMRKLIILDVRRLMSNLIAVPIVALMAYSYQLLTPAIQAKLFGPDPAHGFVFWNFMSQSLLGGTDVFGFFLTADVRATMQQNLSLTELTPHSFEAAAILAGLKLYGLLIIISVLRVLGAPIVIWRTWMRNSKQARRKAK